MNKLEVLKFIAEEFRKKYGEEPGIMDELGQIIINSVEPIVPKEIEAILDKTATKFSITKGDLTYVVGNESYIVITLKK